MQQLPILRLFCKSMCFCFSAKQKYAYSFQSFTFQITDKRILSRRLLFCFGNFFSNIMDSSFISNRFIHKFCHQFFESRIDSCQCIHQTIFSSRQEVNHDFPNLDISSQQSYFRRYNFLLTYLYSAAYFSEQHLNCCDSKKLSAVSMQSTNPRCAINTRQPSGSLSLPRYQPFKVYNVNFGAKIFNHIYMLQIKSLVNNNFKHLCQFNIGPFLIAQLQQQTFRSYV
eukprot:TRINITY_DN2281_c0_g2_i3.p1 TRINITY_DN2281_c0_g2~~TRINITY_DN2281_c0_g2_i3.p1  ORF type:complete len:226 (+),score=-25.50 TRINITY_DN2281_c0_g2_i3:479-1156(+)